MDRNTKIDPKNDGELRGENNDGENGEISGEYRDVVNSIDLRTS